MQVMDDVDSADLLNTSRNEETANNNVDTEDNASVTDTATDEDITGAMVNGEIEHPTSATVMDDSRESADAVGAEESRGAADVTVSRGLETDDTADSMDESAKGDSNEGESDCDSTNETACLEAMTPDGQDFYLRLGDTPLRRSALRLSRIIARQQLLRRLAQGRHRVRAVVCYTAGVLL